MDAEIKAALQKQMEAFEAFKVSNNERLGQVEKKGSADPLLVEKVEKQNAVIGELQKTIEELNAKAGRRATTDAEGHAEEHKTEFNAYLRKGLTQGLADLQKKAVSIGTSTDGGYAVPEGLETSIITLEHKYSPMRELCGARTVSNENWEQLASTGSAASGWVGETAARPETNTPTLASITGAFGEVYANPGISQRALEDIMFDAEKWLAGEVAREFSEQENQAFLSGSGTNKPKGLLAYTLSTSDDSTRTFGQIQKIHTGSSGSLGTATNAGDKLLDIIHALKRGYRQGAVWMMSNLTVAAIRKLKDDVGNYLWKPGIAEGPQGSLFGYPIYENDDMADVGTADANAVVFANFPRAYAILDRRGVVVLRDPFTNKPKVNFYTTKRVGGGLLDSNAVKVLALST
jgi:HK97 family phage major capsid protein